MKFSIEKDFKTRSGIYKITSTINSKIYVGSAKNLYHRYHNHMYQLRYQKHHSKEMQQQFNEFKYDAFRFELIEYCEHSKLLEREQYYLDLFDSANKEIGFNISPTAGYSTNVIRTQESKDKISASLKKYYSTAGNLEKLRNRMSSERRKRITKECQNRPEVKAKLRALRLGEKNPQAKLKEEKVIEIKKLLKTKTMQQKDIAIMFNISKGVICQINTGRLWGHLEE